MGQVGVQCACGCDIAQGTREGSDCYGSRVTDMASSGAAPAPAAATRFLATVAGRATRRWNYRGLGSVTAALSRLSSAGMIQVTVDGQPFLVPAGDPYWSRLIAAGYEYEPDLWWVVNHAPFGFDLLDVGANIGYWSTVITHRDPEAKVVAVEPNPASMALLRRNVPPPGAVVEAAAVARPATTVDLIVAKPGASDAGASIATDVGVNGQRVTVPAVQIVDLLAQFSGRERPLMLKLDVEGVEVELLDAVLPEANSSTLVVFEDHGRDSSCAATAAALRHGWKVGLLSETGVRRIQSTDQLARLKTRPSVGYNVAAWRPDGPWAEMMSTRPDSD